MIRDHQSMPTVYTPTVCVFVFGLKYEDEENQNQNQNPKHKYIKELNPTKRKEENNGSLKTKQQK